MVKETLMKFNKDKLVSALKALAFQGYSKMKKEELADALAKLLEDNGNYEKVRHMLELPEKAANQAEKKPQKSVKSSSDGLEIYIKAFLNLYGVITPDKAMELYNLYHKDQPLSHEVFYTQIAELEKQKNGIYLTEGYLCQERYSQDAQRMAELIRIQGDKPYYMPAKEKLLSYAEDMFFEKRSAYVFLEHFINQLSPNQAEAICQEIQKKVLQNEDMQEIFKIFEAYEVVFETHQQMQRAVQRITDLMNDTRIQENRGYTPNEIIKLYQQTHSAEEEPMKPQPVRGRKIGRNDPCPCGSGKKYKKCCGR